MPTLQDAYDARACGEMIGKGVFREVFWIDGEEWAFKFEVSDWQWNSNEQEYANYLKWKDIMPEGIDIPEMEVLSSEVLAVKYIKGQRLAYVHGRFANNCTCPSYGLIDCAYDLVNLITGIKDLHGSNVMVSPEEGMVYLVDLGEKPEVWC